MTQINLSMKQRESLLQRSFGCFHFLAIMNNAAMIIVVQICVHTYVFHSLGYILKCGIAGS